MYTNPPLSFELTEFCAKTYVPHVGLEATGSDYCVSRSPATCPIEYLRHRVDNAFSMPVRPVVILTVFRRTQTQPSEWLIALKVAGQGLS